MATREGDKAEDDLPSAGEGNPVSLEAQEGSRRVGSGGAELKMPTGSGHLIHPGQEHRLDGLGCEDLTPESGWQEGQAKRQSFGGRKLRKSVYEIV